MTTMTKKRFKVWDKNNWGEVTWLGSRLDQLIYQAIQLEGRFSLSAYIITTSVPPLLASQQENYSMVKTVTRHRFSKEIAEELIADKGAFAHFYALEKLENKVNETLWRDVLAWLDEMEKPHGRVDTDDERPREEPTNHTDYDS